MKYLLILFILTGCCDSEPDYTTLRDIQAEAQAEVRAELAKKQFGVHQKAWNYNGAYYLDTWVYTEKYQAHNHGLLGPGEDIWLRGRYERNYWRPLETVDKYFLYDSLTTGDFESIKRAKPHLYAIASQIYRRQQHIKDSIVKAAQMIADSVKTLNDL
jgi:hypothetical protein